MPNHKKEDPRDPLVDPVAARFHTGAHPQRPLPSDMTEEEEGMLNRERAALHTSETDKQGVPIAKLEEEGMGRKGMPMVNPDKPNQGVLYTGPTAEEELAVHIGVPVKDAAGILEGPRQRSAAARHPQAKMEPAKKEGDK